MKKLLSIITAAAVLIPFITPVAHAGYVRWHYRKNGTYVNGYYRSSSRSSSSYKPSYSSSYSSYSNPGSHYVNGYYRKDGTYVSGHYRTNPDGYLYNNYSYNNTYRNYSPTYTSSSYSYSDSTYTPSSYSYSSYDNSTGGYSYQNSENQYNTTENTTQYNQPVTPYISYPTTINSIKPSIESAPTTTTSTVSTTPVTQTQTETTTTTKATSVIAQTTDIDGKNIKTATIGTYSDSVMNLQKFLAQKGFYTGDIDGIMTIEVLRALRAYQSDKGIGQTGRIDLATQIQIEKDLGL